MLVLNWENYLHKLPDTIPPMEIGTMLHFDGYGANLHIQAVFTIQ